jgi:hypothetical protein
MTHTILRMKEAIVTIRVFLVFVLLCALSARAEMIPPERRIAAWNPGIPGGIPARTKICATIDAAVYGDGTTDATAAIQTAINGCPSGQVVLLPPGTYRTTATLLVLKSIVLRGAGPSQTRIVRDFGSLDLANSDFVLRVGDWGDFNPGISVTGGYDKESTSITVADASSIDVGDVVLVDQLDDPSLMPASDSCTWFKRNAGGYRSLGQMIEIASKSGNTLGLGSPLHFTYSASLQPQVATIANGIGGILKHAGVEDLYISGGSGANVLFVFTAFSWAKNIESDKVWGRSIDISSSYRFQPEGATKVLRLPAKDQFDGATPPIAPSNKLRIN